MSIKIELKNNLRSIREKQQLTQEELANILGLSRMTISAIETGRFVPSAGIAAELCLALNVKFEDLFYLEKVEIDKVKQ